MKLLFVDDMFRADMPLPEVIRSELKLEVLDVKNPNDAITYLTSNCGQPHIILLDIMFNEQALGVQQFADIQRISSLNRIIIHSGNLEKVALKDSMDFINKDVYSIVQRDSSMAVITGVIKDAERSIKHSIKAALESWVIKYHSDNLEEAFSATEVGLYSYSQLLEDIRCDGSKQLDDLISNLVLLAIDLVNTDSGQ